MRYAATLRIMFTLASLVGAGCSSESGASSPRPDAGVDASEGGDAVEPDAEAPDAEVAVACGLVVDPDDVCQACTIAQCCTEAEACAEEPECGQYAPCRATCGEDSTCVDACILTHAAGYVEESLLDGCQATNCNEACGRSPEETCGGALSDATCQSCAQERCCDMLSRFRTSRDGVELSLCELGCPLNDTTCIYDCWGRHEEGFAENLLLTNCLAIECADTCESLLGYRAP